jgi:VWFA-related protein
MHRSALVVVLLLSCGTLAAQFRTGETIEVSIVNVDVIVTDRQGNRVTGLTANDFEIREEGQLRTITNFAEYRASLRGAAASIETMPEAEGPTASQRPPRTIVLFVESARLLPFQTKKMYDSIRELLRTAVAPGDRVTIVTWKGKLIERQPFTDDLIQLESVLAELEKEHVHAERDTAARVRMEQAESNQGARAMGSARSMQQVHALDAALRQKFEIRRKAEALETIINGISAMEGRKIVIMAMRRFGLYAGAEFFPGGDLPPDFELRRRLTTEEYRLSLIRTANANGVTLYAVNTPGLRWTSAPDPSVGEFDGDIPSRSAQDPNELFNEAVAMHHLAADTGGLASWGAWNIADMLPKLADDLDSYYSLAYRASQSTSRDDVTRKIVVRTKNPEYRVRTRKHFVEKSDEAQMRDRVLANFYQPRDGSIPFELTLGVPSRSGRKRWELPLSLRIPIKALATLPNGDAEVGEFSVYVVTGITVGITSEVQRRSQSFRIPRADLARARASQFTFEFTLQVDEKAKLLSVGVVDETSKEIGLKLVEVPPR